MAEELSQEHKTAEIRAQAFEDMARQIRLNKDAKFGGAFLLVQPGAVAFEEMFRSLMLNQEQPAIFWSAIQTLAAMALQDLEKAQRQSGFGR